LGSNGEALAQLEKESGRKRTTSVDPCESSLYLDDKARAQRRGPNLTQWNGRMVMETAFNLHRRREAANERLFVEGVFRFYVYFAEERSEISLQKVGTEKGSERLSGRER
jgi:hypothetical protein